MRKRGVEDFSLTMIDPWAPATPARRPPQAAADLPPADLGALRAGRARLRAPGRGPDRHRSTSTPWRSSTSRDHGVVPLPPKAGNYDAERDVRRRTTSRRSPQLRDDVKPIEITQPEGPSFTVDGHARAAGRSGDLRIGFTPREGLVLHQIGYDDRGTLRPIIHRGVAVGDGTSPTATRRPTHRIKNVFDEGEYGIGLAGQPARRSAATASGEIHYFDGIVNDQDGEPVTIPNAICMHEEDYGHRAGSTPTSAPRRSRSGARGGWSSRCIATVGNYEYGFFWYLYNDGTIEYEVKLTGVLSTGALAGGEQPRARHAGRARPLRAAPPALLLRAAGHGGRRRTELRRRGRLRARCRPGPTTRTATRG